MAATETPPLVGIVMGSRSDWPTMTHAAETLEKLGIAHESRVMSAHRTHGRVQDWTEGARERGLKVIIAGAGGAAHLAGVIAALTPLPVLGVPMESPALKGMDSVQASWSSQILGSTVQMPAGIPVGTLAIGRAGAVNAALLAAAMLALSDPAIADALDGYRERQSNAVPEFPEDPS